MIKIGSIVSPHETIRHELPVTPNIKAEVLNIIDNVAMILPWNSGIECITRLSNLKEVSNI